MIGLLKKGKYENVALIAFILVSILYLIFNTTASVNNESIAVRLSVSIPEIIVWFMAFFSALRFKDYASSIKNSKDGQGLNTIANALTLLVVYVMLITSGNTIVRAFTGSGYLDLAIFLNNHLPVVVALISSILLFNGSRDLIKISKSRPITPGRLVIWGVPSVVLLAAFSWRFCTSAHHLNPIDGIPKFVLPIKLLLFSYLIPHILVWAFGILSCINLASYAAKAPGSLYKLLFKDLYYGLLLVYICIIAAQFIIISSIALNGFSWMLLITYIILLAAIAGFLLIFRGTKKLYKIEKLR